MSVRRLIVGDKIGKLTLLSYQSSRDKHGLSSNAWRCICDCGEIFNKPVSQVNKGISTQCRLCGNKQSGLAQRTSRSDASKKVYNAWAGMKTRCYNPNYVLFHRYGGRGIAVCDEWVDSFGAFLLDMGEPPTKHHSIDRIDNDKGYSKDNCAWSDMVEQANNKSTNAFLELNGKRQTIAEWSAELGIGYETIRMRLRRGATVEKALFKGNANPSYTYSTPDGEFNSIPDICEFYGKGRSTIHSRIASSKFPKWERYLVD